MARYQDIANKWGVSAIKESFELLVEIGNLFVVGYGNHLVSFTAKWWLICAIGLLLSRNG